MAKYKVVVGAFVTQISQRKITVYAKSEEEAILKAKEQYKFAEMNVKNCDSIGYMNIDSIEKEKQYG